MEILELAELVPESENQTILSLFKVKNGLSSSSPNLSSQIIVVLLLVVLVSGFAFFLYNWWKCFWKSPGLEEESQDIELGALKPKKHKSLLSI